MKAWHPPTLKLRVIVILCSVFILSQLVTLIIFAHYRDSVILSTEATDLAERIIGIVQVAEGFPVEDQQRILAAAETQFLTLFPDIIPTAEVACQNNRYSAQISDRLDTAFAALEGIDASVCVRSFANVPFLGRTTLRSGGIDVLVLINHAGRQNSTFHAVLPAANSLFEDSLLWYLLLVGGIALLLAWYLIRKTVAPIATLATAAEQIGVDIDSPPLDENGPMEVAVAAKAFNTMQQRIVDLLRGQMEMLAAISHDLRSAVTRLQLRVELLENEQERQGMLHVVSDMRQMTDSVLQFFSGQNSAEPKRRVDINALVESLCTDLSEEGFAVSFQRADESVNLLCRPTELRRGLQNIIDNALKYGERANVSVITASDTLRIVVEDDGAGIPEEQLEKVLQPFYRLDGSRSQETGGIGLGLAIAQNIVKAHGGRLTLTNRQNHTLQNQGLRVEVCLPREP